MCSSFLLKIDCLPLGLGRSIWQENLSVCLGHGGQEKRCLHPSAWFCNSVLLLRPLQGACCLSMLLFSLQGCVISVFWEEIRLLPCLFLFSESPNEKIVVPFHLPGEVAGVKSAQGVDTRQPQSQHGILSFGSLCPQPECLSH